MNKFCPNVSLFDIQYNKDLIPEYTLMYYEQSWPLEYSLAQYKQGGKSTASRFNNEDS